MENQSDDFMSSRFYKAAATGDVDYLKSHRESDRINDLLSLTSEENNCLHIAARYGHEDFVWKVLTLCPTLAYQQHKRGDNPLHVFARAGHLRVVKLLTDNCLHLLQHPQTFHDINESVGNRALNTVIEGIQPVERLSLTREAEQGETTIHQNQDENYTTTLIDVIQPPQTPPSTVNSIVTAIDDVILALRDAEQGKGLHDQHGWLKPTK
ncbi:hypothetical protein NE237_005893 [Protea cynaroides]|uniref:Uncharacterized protein n=1 Tax=Protea cynaroides TaxID=273540 RepID=A0A9Q0QV13_9MAGN|nr:hypothetical protein NE237_005893 [Protea cynaroides]